MLCKQKESVCFAYKKRTFFTYKIKAYRISYRLLNSTLTNYRVSYTFAKAGLNLRVVLGHRGHLTRWALKSCFMGV